MRPASSSRGPAARQPGPDDYSPARGRELADRRDEVRVCPRSLSSVAEGETDESPR